MSLRRHTSVASHAVCGLLGLACQAEATLDRESEPHPDFGDAPEPAPAAAERPIVFVSTRAGNDGQIYGARADGSDLVRLVDIGGVVDPVWALDGRTIAFRKRV